MPRTKKSIAGPQENMGRVDELDSLPLAHRRGVGRYTSKYQDRIWHVVPLLPLLPAKRRRQMHQRAVARGRVKASMKSHRRRPDEDLVDATAEVASRRRLCRPVVLDANLIDWHLSDVRIDVYLQRRRPLCPVLVIAPRGFVALMYSPAARMEGRNPRSHGDSTPTFFCASAAIRSAAGSAPSHI